MSGSLPLARSATSRPAPADIVQPSVPWPVLISRFSKRVRPMTGTLSGVVGLSPAQNSAREASPQRGKRSIAAVRMEWARAPLKLVS